MKKADIGLIGLAVMGENLVVNMESKGFTVAVFNRTTEKVDKFVNGRAAGKNIIGCHSLKELVDNLEKPRKVFMMVKAGQAVDDMIEQLLPLLDDGDILIDGGNSHFPDTIRRTAYVESKGKLYIGTGVSGGEEGALNGPSMMPGGSPAAWPYVKPIFQSICAKVEDGSPCCDWVGENGAGHFVKMVHNGIEYGDMQLICEAYQLMRDLLGMNDDEMHEVFAAWNKTELDSYLIEITRDILAYKDTDGQPIETVNEVDGVRDGDDPDDRDRDGQPAEVQIRRLGEDVRVRDELDPAAVPDRDARRGDLHEQLRQRLERHDIVQHAEDHDHDRAEQDALHLPVDLREDEHGEQERQKNGQTAHPGDRHLVHAPVILRHIDRADLARQRLDQRRRRK